MCQWTDHLFITTTFTCIMAGVFALDRFYQRCRFGGLMREQLLSLPFLRPFSRSSFSFPVCLKMPGFDNVFVWFHSLYPLFSFRLDEHDQACMHLFGWPCMWQAMVSCEVTLWSKLWQVSQTANQTGATSFCHLGCLPPHCNIYSSIELN